MDKFTGKREQHKCKQTLHLIFSYSSIYSLSQVCSSSDILKNELKRDETEERISNAYLKRNKKRGIWYQLLFLLAATVIIFAKSIRVFLSHNFGALLL